MKNKWQDYYDNKPAVEHKGDDYTLLRYFPETMRYSEADHSMTIVTELLDATERFGRKWFLFRNWLQYIYLPNKPMWDDGTPIDADKRKVIAERIAAVLTKAGIRWEIDEDDGPYRRLAGDSHSRTEEH